MNGMAASAVVAFRSAVPSGGGYQSASGWWSASRMEGFFAEGTVSASCTIPPPSVGGDRFHGYNPTTGFIGS